jgi:lipoprotein LprG
MREIRTVSFALTVEGRVGPLGIRRAEGVLTRSGDAAGTVLVEQAGTAIEYEVVIARGTYYLKGPTGGFRALPATLSRAAYNPAGLLGPEGGLAGLLARAREARTVAAEAVRGTGAFRVVARVDAGPVGQLVPLPAGARSVAADLWVGGEPPRLLRVRVAAAGDARRSVLEVTLGEFDAPVTVTPPPT